MQAAKELADINVLVSQGKALLKKIQEDKDSFVESQKKEVIDVIHKLVEESKNLFEEAKSNYAGVHEFHETLMGFSKFLQDGQAEFKKMLADFAEASTAERKEIEEAREEVRKLRQQVEADANENVREKKALAVAKGFIERDRLKLADDQGTIARAINRLKENRI